MFPSGQIGDLREELEIPAGVGALATIASCATGQTLTNCDEARDEAAGRQTSAACACRLIILASGARPGELICCKLAVWSQHSGHIHKASVRRAVLWRAGSRGSGLLLVLLLLVARGAERGDIGGSGMARDLI